MWEVRGTVHGVMFVFLVWMTEWIKNAFTKMVSGEEKETGIRMKEAVF